MEGETTAQNSEGCVGLKIRPGQRKISQIKEKYLKVFSLHPTLFDFSKIPIKNQRIPRLLNMLGKTQPIHSPYPLFMS